MGMSLAHKYMSDYKNSVVETVVNNFDHFKD